MRLTINLATKTYLNMRQLNLFIAGAFAILLILLLVNIENIANDFKELGQLHDRIADLEGKTRKVAGSAVPEKEYEDLLAKIKFANGVIEQKSFDWLTLLDRLEEVVPDGIAITAIEPAPREGDLKLVGIANGFANIRKLMENLESSKFFTEVYLVSQTDMQVSQTEKGTAFQIICKVGYK